MNKQLVILKRNTEVVNGDSILRLARLSAIRNSQREVLSDDLKDLACRCGFVRSVSLEILAKAKFRYCANVRGYAICNANFPEYPPKYTGEIPEFALDTMELAIKLGMPFITIHSTQPFERHDDPVLVGWFDSPLRRGIILAIWDSDLELEAL